MGRRGAEPRPPHLLGEPVAQSLEPEPSGLLRRRPQTRRGAGRTPDLATEGIDFDLTRGGTLSGRITDAATGGGLSGVYIDIYDAANRYLTCGYSDDQGNYVSRAGLSSGFTYPRTYNHLGYLDELYDDIPCPSGSCWDVTGTPVGVTLGSDTGGVDFALARGASLSGTVTDEATGQPLASVYVSIYDGKGNWATYDYTDGAGSFRSRSGLPGGSSFALADARGAYRVELWDDLPCPGYSCTVTAGTPIAITLGLETGGVDFALRQGLAPDNDACASAPEVGPGILSGSTLFAAAEGGASCGLSDLSPDVWYRYTAADDVTLTADTCDGGTEFDTVLSLHRGCPADGGAEITCNDDSACPIDHLHSSATARVRAGETVLLRVSGYNGAGGDFVLRIAESFEPIVALTVGGTCPGLVSLTVAGATPDGSVALGMAIEAGDTVVPRGSCAGTHVDLDRPRLLGVFPLDPAGGLATEVPTPGSACGQLLQVMDTLTCEASGLGAIPVPAGAKPARTPRRP